MKSSRRFILIVFILFFVCFQTRAQVDRVEPPFWWTGMKNHKLQLMIYGENITETQVFLEYKGVQLDSVISVKNPNYLFIDLNLDKDVKPGSFDIQFKLKGKTQYSYRYTLHQRKAGSGNREGFNNSDVMYLLMPDRFANGDPGNDEVEGLREGLSRSEPYGRHGGDIIGVIDNLDYLRDMGFTAIWLNPVLENNQEQWSYHGYATTDYYRVDPRLGSNEDYRKLCEMAKEKGIKLVMDMIFNHCGSEHWWMKDVPMQDWINLYPDYAVSNHRRTTNQDPHASDSDKKLMTEGWFVPTMPDLNLGNSYLANYLTQNSIWWIEYVGLAGIRMDTYPYPDKYAMAEWNKRILEEYPDFNITGEDWTLNPALVSYWQKGQSNHDGYDGYIPSMMDFPLQNALFRALTEEEAWDSGLITLYEMLANDFLYPDPKNLVIFPDNHDMPRFYMQLNMDAELYKMGITYILTTRGIPQIYYGSEILMTHTEGNDHGYIRKDFPGGWRSDAINGFTGEGLTTQEKDMQDFFMHLLNWRKENTVIHTGKLTHFAPKNGVYVYFRHNMEKTVMIILNKNTDDTLLKLSRFGELIKSKKTGTDVLSRKEFDLQGNIKLPPKAALVLELN